MQGSCNPISVQLMARCVTVVMLKWHDLGIWLNIDDPSRMMLDASFADNWFTKSSSSS